MPYSTTCSTKIITLAISPFLFILVDALCEFTMVVGVCTSSCGYRCTHSAAHPSKRFKPLSAITLLCQGYC